MGDTMLSLPNNTTRRRRSRGIFGGSHRCMGLHNITDGSSNTIAMSERAWGNDLPPTTATNQDVRTVTAMSVSSIGSNPGSCFAKAIGNHFIGVQVKGKFGALWSDGQAERVGFNTVLPPNAPSCVNDGNTNADSNGGVLNASSMHPNGVNSVFADGSIHFITQNINTGNRAAPPPLPGQSVRMASGGARVDRRRGGQR